MVEPEYIRCGKFTEESLKEKAKKISQEIDDDIFEDFLQATGEENEKA